MSKWGVRWIKADNCSPPPGSARDYFSSFSRAVNSTGVPIVFHSCEWGLDDVAAWGPNVTQVYRVRPDHLPFWWFNLPGAYPPGGQGTGDIIEGMADPAVLAGQGPYSWPDPDVLHTGLFQTEAESQTEFSFWSLWGAPLLLATDPRNMSDFKRSVVLNEEALDVQRGDAIFGRGARRVRGDNSTGVQVWVKTLGEGGPAVIILYNSGDWLPVDISIDWEELGGGWPTNVSLNGRDLWMHADIFTAQKSGAKATGIPVHGVRMWKLSVSV